jgi:hypothetical protein
LRQRAFNLFLLLAVLFSTSGLGLFVHERLEHARTTDRAVACVAADDVVASADDTATDPTDRPVHPRHRAGHECAVCATLMRVAAVVVAVSLSLLEHAEVAPAPVVEIDRPVLAFVPAPRSTRGPPALA